MFRILPTEQNDASNKFALKIKRIWDNIFEEIRKKGLQKHFFRGLNRTVGPIRFKIEIWPGEGLPEGW